MFGLSFTSGSCGMKLRAKPSENEHDRIRQRQFARDQDRGRDDREEKNDEFRLMHGVTLE